MNYRNLLSFLLLALFLFTISGCGQSQNVIDNNAKTGLTPEERASKRGR